MHSLLGNRNRSSWPHCTCEDPETYTQATDTELRYVDNKAEGLIGNVLCYNPPVSLFFLGCECFDSVHAAKTLFSSRTSCCERVLSLFRDCSHIAATATVQYHATQHQTVRLPIAAMHLCQLSSGVTNL